MDLDGKKIARLKYKKKKHPLVVSVPTGDHILTYRKKNKLAMGWNNAMKAYGAGTVSGAIIANNTKDDQTSYKIQFNPNTTVVLQVEGGISKGHRILEKECQL